jgi:site-specific DNA-methyltransferase (adenine-specific)
LLNKFQSKKEPDVLEVISDLSNEEVFTPPAVARSILDLLPEEVWSNPELKWIDPFSKTGVFLREVVKRLLVGLESEIPDPQERLTHILHNMVYGVAITELTALMSRRTLYSSKTANGPKSSVKMPAAAGNLLFKRLEHEFLNRKCGECHASEKIYGWADLEIENHAYALLHQRGREWIEQEIGLKFDIVVGNPPYQIEVDESGQNINPLYHLFIGQAKALQPKYISMVIPSRWMAAGKGLGAFRQEMLADDRIRKLVDFPNAEEVFPVVGKTIEGGICFFLWDESHSGPCEFTSMSGGNVVEATERHLDEFDVLVRSNASRELLKKVLSHDYSSLSSLVSSRDPFGPALSSNFKGFHRERQSEHDLVLYMNQGSSRLTAFVDLKYVTKNLELVQAWKVFVPKARGVTKTGPDVVIGTPILGEPGSVCTLTYLAIGPFSSKNEAEHFLSYLKTRFVRHLISLRKPTQDTTQASYQWVPLLDFSRPWSDIALAELFDLSRQEIDFLEAKIRPLT